MQSTTMILGSGLLLALAACGSENGGLDAVRLSIGERRWVDTTRTALGSPRDLRVRIWTSLSNQPAPLLVLAHGFGGSPEKFDAMAADLARHGYLVVAPAFPLTNEAAPGGHQNHLGDFRNQPGDVSFLLDRLLEANESPSDSLFGRIDRSRILLFGHSLGGVTALGLTRHSCCRDERVVAAIVADTPAFLETGFRDSLDPLPIPVLVLHGMADETVDFASASELLRDLRPPAFLVGIVGAGHSDAFEDQTVPASPSRAAAQRAILAFLGFSQTRDSTAFQRDLEQLAAEGHTIRLETE